MLCAFTSMISLQRDKFSAPSGPASPVLVTRRRAPLRQCDGNKKLPARSPSTRTNWSVCPCDTNSTDVQAPRNRSEGRLSAGWLGVPRAEALAARRLHLGIGSPPQLACAFPKRRKGTGDLIGRFMTIVHPRNAACNAMPTTQTTKRLTRL
jgi:hypothetical protein